MSTAFSSVGVGASQPLALVAKMTAAAQPVSSSSKELPVSNSRPFHRIAEVRAQQGLSLRTVSRRTGIDIKELRRQELPTTDLSISQLTLWQQALEVPLIDLLVDDSQTLSRPVKERAKLVRIMKSVVSLLEVAESQPRVHRLATMLKEQLLDLMPELADVGGWPQCGTRRGADVLGRILFQPISVDVDIED